MRLRLKAGSLFVCSALLCATAAFADIPGPLKAAIIKSNDAKSYHIVMSGKHLNATGDFVKPSTMDLRMSGGVETIVADKTMYMKMHGSWMKVGPADMDSLQQDIGKVIATHELDYTVTDLGMSSVDGAPLHAYAALNNKTHRTTKLFVDGSGYVSRTESTNVTTTLSNFGAPIYIKAPI